jgi:hypothetical protein
VHAIEVGVIGLENGYLDLGVAIHGLRFRRHGPLRLLMIVSPVDKDAGRFDAARKR